MNRFAAVTSAAALAVALAAAGYAFLDGAPRAEAQEQAGPDTLAVVWTSADDHVAHRMCLMYAHAAKTQGWFEEVHLIIWGPSQRLLVADESLQEKVAEMREDGVRVEACIACASSYGLVDDLEALGLPVEGMGKPLSEHLKRAGSAVATF
jgi:hypothetical protein